MPNQSFDPFAGAQLQKTAPSTGAQRELWTAARLGDEASLAFNESISLELQGPLDELALRQALTDLVARHESLRITFSEDGLSLIVAAPENAALELHDLSPLRPADRSVREAALLSREVETPFDLVKGPLFRAHLICRALGDHRLVFTVHHIVCDGWSTGVLVQDLARLYSARRQRTSSALPPAEAFSDYALTQAAAAHSAQSSADEAYWLSRFSDRLPIFELPTDRPRPRLKTFASRRCDTRLDGELLARLKKAGAKERTSLFTFLLAGFWALLHRLGAQEDLIVGIPAAGQAPGGHAALVGHDVRTLPLRAQVRGDASFAALLADARTALLDGLEHQTLTLGQLLEKLALQRDPSRLPLVNVLFNVDRALPRSSLAFHSLEVSLSTNPRHFETFELFVNAVEDDSGLMLQTQYNADLYDEATVRRFLACYRTLLDGAAADPQATVAALPLLPRSQRDELEDWNRTSFEYPRALRVDQLVSAQAARSPESIALESGLDTLTYASLEARSNQVARRLRALGVGRGILVGLSFERGLEMMIALLGTLKAGGTYVPLDPGFPRERITLMLEDSHLSVLITHHGLAVGQPGAPAAVLAFDGDAAAIAAESATPLEPSPLDANPEEAAYVLYTSGSTGRPKGVAVPHRAVVNFLATTQREPGMAAGDVLLAVTTLSFDIAVLELLLPLTVGARVVIASRDAAMDGAQLLELVRTRGITVMQATPSTWRLLLEAGWSKHEPLRAICGGEALTKGLAEDLLQRASVVFNMYGPTETTVWSTCSRLQAPISRVTIGRPIGNTQVHVLDSSRERVPVGATGELYIGGDGVALGYLGRDDLTAERFVPDPFRGGAVRMYRTGDVVRWLPDGTLEYLGRNDAQVKVRGFRIELGEIESVLSRHPDVAQAAVIVREDRPGDKRLVAYLGGTPPEDSALRAHLRKALPEYMVPSTFVRLPALPLTPNGKIDRKALLTPVQEAQESAAFVAPRTPSETLLAGLWSEALGIARVSVEDDFFSLGGHSLLASQVLARLRFDHGFEIPFRKMFEAPTIAQFAPLLDAPASATQEDAAAIQRRADPGPAPLSHIQERIWMLEEMHPAQRVVHNLPGAWRLTGKLDSAALERALQQIVCRHETLRTSVATRGALSLQQVTPEMRCPLSRLDLRSHTDPETEMLRELSSRARVPFDLSHAPLLRATLVQLRDEEHVLFVLPHNLVWDGWSFDVFWNELSALYPAESNHLRADLPDLPISYSDYTSWHRLWRDSLEFKRQAQYWLSQFAEPPPILELPTDWPRPDRSDHLAGNVGALLTRDQADALLALGREHGATLFMVLFTAFNVLLSRTSGQPELVIGTPVRARTRREMENLIGPFINAVALRTRIGPQMTFLQLLAQVREKTLDGFSNQELPLEMLGIHSPVLRAFFSLQDARQRPLQLGKLGVAQVHVPPPGAANDLMLWTMDTARGLYTMLNYRADLFEAATMQRLLGRLQTLLAAVVRTPDAPIVQLDLLPGEEREELRRLSVSQAVPPKQTLADLLLGHPAAAPALHSPRNTVSYAKLEVLSHRLASALRRLKMADGAPVAVLVRSPLERAQALLGIARAGAAALLLDVAEPRARRDALLAAVGPAALVSSTGLEDQLPPGAPLFLIDNLPEVELARLAPIPQEIPVLLVPQYAAGRTPTVVGISQSALARQLAAARDALSLGPQDIAVSALSSGHEAAAIEVLLPLCAGASLRALEAEEPLDGEELLQAMEGSGVTLLCAPVTLWQQLVTAGLRNIGLRGVCVGEPPAPTLGAELRQRLREVFVAWGHSEAGIWTTLGPVDPDGRAFLGKALGMAELHVLDPLGSPVPLGVFGALHVGTQKFSTGERARLLGDGSLELGAPGPREVVRGFRADLGEVSAALAQHPAVADAAVAVRTRRGGEKRLTAWFVALPSAKFTETELRRFLRKALPPYLVPQEFVEVTSLHRGAQGAVEFAKLPQPTDPQDGRHEFVAPQTAAERMLAALWKEALGVDRVGRHDNFFELGGHSLLCLQVIAQIADQTGQRLSPRVLLLNTLEQAAAQVPV